MSFATKCLAEKKEDKINTDGTIQDLQVINFVLSMCGQDAIIIFRSLMSRKNLIGVLYKDVRSVIQNYVSPKERVVTAEKAKFLSVIQGLGKSDEDIRARRRDPVRELGKIKFISGLRDSEAKHRLVDGIKAKPAMSVTEITEKLHFRSHAMAFASSSSGNKPFIVKEKVGFNFKNTFEKKQLKIFRLIKATICALGVAVSHLLVEPVQRLEKKQTCEKVGHFSKMCRSKPQTNSGKCNKQNNFCEEENISSEQASPSSEMIMFYAKEQILNISVTRAYIAVNNCKVKMQVETSANSIAISSKI